MAKKERIGILIFVSIALMLMIDCGKEIETPTPTEFRKFSKYGFSFEYPKDFNVRVGGALEKEANDNSGAVQVVAKNEEIKGFQVSWLKTPDINLEVAHEVVRSVLADVVGSFEWGKPVETTKAGHKMVYQYYSTTDTEGNKCYGIVGAFYCDKSQKCFTPMTLNNTISDKQDILDDFKNYLDSFVCH